MSLTTYAGLQASIADTLHRTDITSPIVDAIALTEAQMNRRLRTRRMVARETATLTSEYSAVPSDFLGLISLTISASPPVKLIACSPGQMETLAHGMATGTPNYVGIVGGEFRYYPVPSSSAAVLTYWQAIPALSVSSTSNWVLANHPDAYLYGALTQMAPYLGDDDRLAMWSALYTNAITDIEAADRVESFGELTPQPNGYAW